MGGIEWLEGDGFSKSGWVGGRMVLKECIHGPMLFRNGLIRLGEDFLKSSHERKLLFHIHSHQ
jgi:hypothetical protein